MLPVEMCLIMTIVKVRFTILDLRHIVILDHKRVDHGKVHMLEIVNTPFQLRIWRKRLGLI